MGKRNKWTQKCVLFNSIEVFRGIFPWSITLRNQLSDGMLDTSFDLTKPAGHYCDLLIPERESHSFTAGGVEGVGWLKTVDKVKDVQ